MVATGWAGDLPRLLVHFQTMAQKEDEVLMKRTTAAAAVVVVVRQYLILGNVYFQIMYELE